MTLSYSLAAVLVGIGLSTSSLCQAGSGAAAASGATAPTAKPLTSQPEPYKPPLTVEGAIHFTPRELKFGRIPDSAEVKSSVKITNTGCAPVTVKSIAGTCGCLVPSALVKPTLEPGEEAEIAVRFNPANRQGPEWKVVTVESDDPKVPKSEFLIYVNVVPRIGIEPRNLWMGEFKQGVASDTKPLRVTLRDEGVEIQSVSCEDPRFEIREVEKSELEEAGGKVRVRDYTVKFLGGGSIENLRSWLSIKTNHPTLSHINVPVLAHVIGNLQFIPERKIMLRLDKAGAPFSQPIMILSRDKSLFTISDIKANGPDELHLKLITKDSLPGFPNSIQLVLEGITPELPKPEVGLKNIEIGISFKTSTVEEPDVLLSVVAMLVPPQPTPTAPASNGPLSK